MSIFSCCLLLKRVRLANIEGLQKALIPYSPCFLSVFPLLWILKQHYTGTSIYFIFIFSPSVLTSSKVDILSLFLSPRCTGRFGRTPTWPRTPCSVWPSWPPCTGPSSPTRVLRSPTWPTWWRVCSAWLTGQYAGKRRVCHSSISGDRYGSSAHYHNSYRHRTSNSVRSNLRASVVVCRCHSGWLSRRCYYVSLSQQCINTRCCNVRLDIMWYSTYYEYWMITVSISGLFFFSEMWGFVETQHILRGQMSDMTLKNGIAKTYLNLTRLC